MTRDDLSRLSPAEKDALILALLDRVAALEERRNRPAKTAGNSSLPPLRGAKATRPPWAGKPGRKRDGPGVSRTLAATPDQVIDCPAVDCPHCGTSLDADQQSPRQCHDHITLPEIRPVVTRVRLLGRRCPGCRRRVRGAPPPGMPPGTPFGVSITTLLAYLHSHHAIGYARLSGLMAELFGLSISEGAIANVLHRTGKALEPAGTAILKRLRQASVICCDETGARVTTATGGTRLWWEWVLLSDDAGRIAPSRGRGVTEEVLGDHRPDCWVSDRWAAQQADHHQVCLAHAPRDIHYAPDRGEGSFATGLLDLPHWVIAIGRRRSSLRDNTLKQYRGQADRRLDAILKQPTPTKAGAALRQQTMRWRARFFTFLTHRAVPATNNAAERAPRPSVIFRKVTNGFRSQSGADTHALIRSVIGTGRINGLSPHQALNHASDGIGIIKTKPATGAVWLWDGGLCALRLLGIVWLCRCHTGSARQAA